MRGSTRLAFAIAVGVAGMPLMAAAQTQIKPRVLLMVDTSGSMLETFGGTNRGADGSSSFTDAVIGTNNTFYRGYSSANTTCPATAPFLGSQTKMFAAKQAVTNVINGSGDIDWGLERYAGTQCAVVDTTSLAFGVSVDTCYADGDCSGGRNAADDCNGGNGPGSCRCTSNGNAACRSGICFDSGGGRMRCGCNDAGDCASGSCDTTTHLCNCNNDDQCNPGAFCNTSTHKCFIDNNLCVLAYGQTDIRSRTQSCGNHNDLPVSYAGNCGATDNQSGGDCVTMQTCTQDSDCGPSGPITTPAGGGANAKCVLLGAGPQKVCSCSADSDCPNNGTQVFTCQATAGGSPAKACTYALSCDTGGTVTAGVSSGGGGFILVDPAAGTPLSVLPYVDGVEKLNAPANPELRAVGGTPLAGAARTATAWYNDIVANNRDPQILCRPYVLVQLTDGQDTCENDNGGGTTENNFGTVAAAGSFVAATKAGARVQNKVYMIGMALTGTPANVLNAAARAGGTGTARFANSQSDIEAALADIVASSVLVEKCNYVDDDCDGLVDQVYSDVVPSPTNNVTSPSYVARFCNNGAVGHCAAVGTFKCDSTQLSETCGPSACRYGAGTTLAKSGSTMTLSGISGFASNFTGLTGSITIVAARFGANLGTFPITAGGAGTVSFTNANGVAEAITGNQIGFEYNCALTETCRLGSGTGFTKAGNSITMTGITGGILNTDVGDSITITSATSTANQGTYLVTAVGPGGCTNNCTSVTFTNPNGVAEGGTPGFSIGCRDPMCRRNSGATFTNKTATTIDLTNGSGFTSNDLNAMITIVSATNPTNTGTFKIVSVLSASSVRIANSNGVAEAGNVAWNIYCANAESAGGCNNFDDDCNGVPDDCIENIAGSCCTSNGCQPVETCNGIDDDCNGIIDDNPVDVGVPCNSDVGDCQSGILKCCNGAGAGEKCIGDLGFVANSSDFKDCIGGVKPQAADVCDGTDDNCDGTVNGVPPQQCFDDPTSSPRPFPMGLAGHGLCRAGSQDCTTVGIDCNTAPCGPGWPVNKPSPNPVHTFTACSGAVGPHTELCDGFDNDCNDQVDDNPKDPWIGSTCCPTGNPNDCTNTGTPLPAPHCALGTLVCCTAGTPGCGALGTPFCQGGVAKSPEVCDGIDNDCNGIIDDVPGLGSTCTANGVLNAGACSAKFVCVVGTPGMCDGVPCPNGLTCQQMGTPTTEVCNGMDDDCNGIVDDPNEVTMNDPFFQNDSNGDGKPDCMVSAPYDTCKPGTPECVGGMKECVGVLPSPNPNGCGQTDCNGNPVNDCPPGSTCYMGQCVTPCADGEFPCPGGFICDRSVDPALCVPDQCSKLNCPSGQNCVLDTTTNMFTCVDPCAGRDCGTGKRCVNGGCVDDTCRTFGCPDGQICVGNPGSCEMDPCAGLECDSSQYCSNGSCVPLCSTCMKGDHCVEGMCEPDPCAGVKCNAGQSCMVANGVGSCVSNVCAGTQCGQDQTCCGGSCINDPCQKVKCPAGIVCTIDDTCTASCSQAAPPDKDQIVGAGGGGFSCSIGSHGGSEGLWLMLLLLFLFRRSRREEGGR